MPRFIKNPSTTCYPLETHPDFPPPPPYETDVEPWSEEPECAICGEGGNLVVSLLAPYRRVLVHQECLDQACPETKTADTVTKIFDKGMIVNIIACAIGCVVSRNPWPYFLGIVFMLMTAPLALSGISWYFRRYIPIEWL